MLICLFWKLLPTSRQEVKHLKKNCCHHRFDPLGYSGVHHRFDPTVHCNVGGTLPYHLRTYATREEVNPDDCNIESVQPSNQPLSLNNHGGNSYNETNRWARLLKIFIPITFLKKQTKTIQSNQMWFVSDSTCILVSEDMTLMHNE